MVHRIGRHCRFRLIRPTARRVYLVGDFNDWSPTAVAMERLAGGVWQAHLDLPPGTYRFRYFVDQRWETDFAAFGIERNANGQWDSIVYIPDGEPGPEAEVAFTPAASTARAPRRPAPTRRRRARTEAPVTIFDH